MSTLSPNTRQLFSLEELEELEEMRELEREMAIAERKETHQRLVDQESLDELLRRQEAERNRINAMAGSSKRVGVFGEDGSRQENAEGSSVNPKTSKPTITAKKPLFFAEPMEDRVKEFLGWWSRKSLREGAKWVEDNDMVSHFLCFRYFFGY
jgi:hypothetical protein